MRESKERAERWDGNRHREKRSGIDEAGLGKLCTGNEK
jgi:hypothetical protein